MRSKSSSVACLFAWLAASALAAAACTTDLDCTLNGVCDASGSCTCYVPWGGADCGQLQMQPVDPVQGYGVKPNLTSWGGSVVLWKGEYHMFVAEMVNHCLLDTWGTNSRVAHAVSPTPTGPYNFSDVALGVWSHNPEVVVQQFPQNTTFVLWHIGTGDGGNPQNCTAEDYVPPALSLEEFRTERLQSAQRPLKDGQSTVHYAASPYGPWMPVLPPPPGCNNPAPMLHPNGTWYALCNDANLYSAPSVWGPWTYLLDVPTNGGVPGTYEDAFLYLDQRGNWHVMWHVYNATTPCDQCLGWMVSGHTFSPDGLTWYNTPTQPYPNTYELTTGETVTVSTRERPKLVFDSNGQITHLSTPVCSVATCPPTPAVNCKTAYWDHTLVVPLAV